MQVAAVLHLPSVVSKLLLEVSWWWVAVGIVLVLAAIVLIVHVLGVLLRCMLGTLAVDEVLALGLGELVDFSTSEPDEEFLGELMLDRLACGLSFSMVWGYTQAC